MIRLFFLSVLLISLLVVRPAVAADLQDGEPPNVGEIRVTLLGTGGGPGGGKPGLLTKRMSTSVLVEAANQMLLFDAGRGTMLRLGQLRKKYMSLIDKVFVSHLHSDHITDLPDLFLNGFALKRKNELRIWGPVGTKNMISHLKDAFRWDLNYRSNSRRGHAIINAIEINEGLVYNQDGVKVTAFDVDHWPPRFDESARHLFPALGYRVDYEERSLVISGDTRFSNNLIKFARGVDLLIHEVHVGLGIKNRGNKPYRRSRRGSHHTSPQDAGRIFFDTKPKLGVFYHIIFGRRSEKDLLKFTRETYQGPLQVGEDLMQFIIGNDIKINALN